MSAAHEHHSHSSNHHHHDHGPANYNRAFMIGIVLNTLYVIMEAVYGLLSHSLSLLADAGHNLSDVLALVLAWVASLLTKKQPTEFRTYGFRRSSILAALFNAIFLLLAIALIAYEAVKSFAAPHPVESSTVIWVAVLGIIINAATALLFLSGRKGDMNIRGAFLHMAADAAVSLGVVIAGIVISFTAWEWLDPLVSLLIVVIIFIGTWSLLKDSVNMALDSVPQGIDIQGIKAYLNSLPNVTDVHDLHIWGMSTTETALTAHLVIPDLVNQDELLNMATQQLQERFGIEHPTLQIERGTFECRLAHQGAI